MNTLNFLMMMIFCGAVCAAPNSNEETSSETNRRIAKECISTHDLSKETIEEFHQNPKDPPKRMLCYIKCFLERKGLIDKDGYINMNYNSGEQKNVEEESSDSSSSSESSSSSDSDEYEDEGEAADFDLRCLKRLEPIQTCGDVKGILKCLPGSLGGGGEMSDLK